MTDDRMETITDPAEIRATDDPDERTTPAPVGAAVALDLDAAHVRTDPACTFHDGATPKASRGKSCPACMRLDLDALHETICDKFTGMAEVRQAADLLVAEVRRLAGIKAHRDNLAAMIRRLSEFLDGRNLNSWKHGACWAAEDAIKSLTARAESAEAEVVTLRAKVAAVEALADQWADRKRSDGMSGNAWIGLTLSGVAADLRAALATAGEGQHVAREVFSAEGIPFVRCSCSTALSPQSAKWLSEHVPNGGVAELQAVVKRQAEGAKA